MAFATSPSNALGSLAAILILALVHLLTKKLDRLEASSRINLLSAGAGASLAYVVVRILPKLAEKQESLLARPDTGLRGFLEHHVYLIALVGLVTYYASSRVAGSGVTQADSASRFRYRMALSATIASYGAYSMLIGYLIVNRVSFGLFSLILITLGMGTLFVVTDHGLHRKWPDAYDRQIRWILASALFAGWAVGSWFEVSPNVVALWYAFLAGVMLIGTIKEKLAIEDSGSFWPFLAGVVTFSALLLTLEWTATALP